MLYTGKASEILKLGQITASNAEIIENSKPGNLNLMWFVKPGRITIDGMDYSFDSNQILCTTEFHRLTVASDVDIRLVRFNRPFYCISDHDDEVSCRGLLFYGATKVPVISIPENELEKFELLWRMFVIEMVTADNLQLEMLRMMLKRLIIICTRLFKEQQQMLHLSAPGIELIREFYYLVEVHFRTKHTVNEYAELLNKSPKTLANLFASCNIKTPLQVIQDRILLEARRLIFYTEKPVKEIAYEVGYADLQSFSRFFRLKAGISPREFRDQRQSREVLTTLREDQPTLPVWR